MPLIKPTQPNRCTCRCIDDGSASDADAARIAAEAKHADMIIAIGGGRLLDTAKLVAEIFDCEYITVPTLASNCAPYTPIGAIYNAVGHTFNRVAYFPRAPYATVVDWDIIATTPEDYLVAGIGDTLAKWYEMEGITRPRRNSLTAFSQLGFSAAQTIRTILQRTAVPAVVALRKGQVTADLVAIADTIIGIAGTVGGFAGADGRMAGAHAIHNGLSYVDETHEILHGRKSLTVSWCNSPTPGTTMRSVHSCRFISRSACPLISVIFTSSAT